MTTYNGHQSYDHWNTALWILNDEGFYNLLTRKAQLVNKVLTKSQAVTEMLRDLPNKTPDGAQWQADTILDLIEEEQNNQEI